MILSEELYFEITLKGKKSEIKRFAKIVKSGELEDFIEVASDYISYCDSFADAGDDEDVVMYFTNDDFGIEIDEFDTAEFLDVLCRNAERLDVVGHFYDINDDEFSFTSEMGSDSFVNARKVARFNDELDEVAFDEETGDEDEE